MPRIFKHDLSCAGLLRGRDGFGGFWIGLHSLQNWTRFQWTNSGPDSVGDARAWASREDSEVSRSTPSPEERLGSTSPWNQSAWQFHVLGCDWLTCSRSSQDLSRTKSWTHCGDCVTLGKHYQNNTEREAHVCQRC